MAQQPTPMPLRAPGQEEWLGGLFLDPVGTTFVELSYKVNHHTDFALKVKLRDGEPVYRAAIGWR